MGGALTSCTINSHTITRKPPNLWNGSVFSERECKTTWYYLATQIVPIQSMAQDLGHILTCVLSLDLFKDELISLQHPRFGVIGRGVYKVTSKQEIRITRRRCPCVECEKDFGRDHLQVVTTLLSMISAHRSISPRSACRCGMSCFKRKGWQNFRSWWKLPRSTKENTWGSYISRMLKNTSLTYLIFADYKFNHKVHQSRVGKCRALGLSGDDAFKRRLTRIMHYMY